MALVMGMGVEEIWGGKDFVTRTKWEEIKLSFKEVVKDTLYVDMPKQFHIATVGRHGYAYLTTGKCIAITGTRSTCIWEAQLFHLPKLSRLGNLSAHSSERNHDSRTKKNVFSATERVGGLLWALEMWKNFSRTSWDGEPLKTSWYTQVDQLSHMNWSGLFFLPIDRLMVQRKQKKNHFGEATP